MKLKTNIKVSIIIPVYNGELYLKKCLESVINQTIKEIEIICINDGSKDKSLEILEQCQKYDKRIKIISKENAGQASARNKGLEIANGEYISFIDSDDYIENSMIEKMYNQAIKENSDLVICDYYEGNEENFKKVKVTKFERKDKYIDYLFSNLGPTNKLIKRKILEENNIKFLEGYIYEDLATVPLFGLYAKNISYIREPLYYYIIREGSTMRQKKYNKKIESIFYVMVYIEQQFKNRGFYEKYKEEIEYLYIEHFLYAGCGRFLEYKEGKESFNKVINIMKEKYPNYKKNKYYKEKNKIFKITCNIFMNNNKFIVNLYNIFRNKVKKG